MSHANPPALPDILDSQVHMTPEAGEAGLLAALDALGIRSLLLEEFWGYDARGLPQPCAVVAEGRIRPLSPLATAAAIRHPERFGFVQRVAWNDPALEAVIEALAVTPGCRGLRMHLFEEPDLAAFRDGRCDPLLACAQRHDLTVGFLAKDAGLVLGETLARFPDARFVIDHCGWPRGPVPWDATLKLAALPNVWLKWGHARRAFRAAGDPVPVLRTELLRALEAFGRERILWASDVTHDASGRPWAELLADVREHPGLSAEDRDWLLARTARAVYRWPLPASSPASA